MCAWIIWQEISNDDAWNTQTQNFLYYNKICLYFVDYDYSRSLLNALLFTDKLNV